MKLVIDGPNEKQALFLLDKHKYIAYGGARGGGKSWAVRTKAKLMALRYPGIRLLIVRRSYPELINNHINTLRKELLGIAKYNDKDKVLRFINGSTINFTYCDRDQDLDRLQGVEYDVIFLDEATQLSEYQMKTIVACVRGVNDFPKRVYFTCNPGGQGHGYIKRLFIDRRFEVGENPADYAFIQARVRDNTALMQTQPEYIRQLEALPPHLREMWLEGRWDVFAGQFFEEFRLDPDPALCKLAGVTAEEAAQQHRFTHVIAPFRIPRGWKIYRSYDFGYNRPFSLRFMPLSRSFVSLADSLANLSTLRPDCMPKCRKYSSGVSSGRIDRLNVPVSWMSSGVKFCFMQLSVMCAGLAADCMVASTMQPLSREPLLAVSRYSP